MSLPTIIDDNSRRRPYTTRKLNLCCHILSLITARQKITQIFFTIPADLTVYLRYFDVLHRDTTAQQLIHRTKSQDSRELQQNRDILLSCFGIFFHTHNLTVLTEIVQIVRSAESSRKSSLKTAKILVKFIFFIHSFS